MMEKWSQEKIDNFFVLILSIVTLFIGGIVAALLMPMSSDLSPETRLLICEKYGFLPGTFSELQAKAGKDDFKYGNLSVDERKNYDKQKKLREICLNSTLEINKEVPLLIKLYYKENENEHLKDILGRIGLELSEIKQRHKLCKNKLEKREQQLQIQKSVFRRTSENIENISWFLPFHPFKIFCLENYNDLVETFAKIYDLEIE